MPQTAWKQLELIHYPYAVQQNDFGSGVPIVFAVKDSTANTTASDILDQPNGPSRESYGLNATPITTANSPYTTDQISKFEWHAVAVESVGAGNYIGVARQALFYDGYQNVTYTPASGSSDLQAAKNGVMTRSIYPLTVAPSNEINNIDAYNTLWVNSSGDTGKPLCGDASESPLFVTGSVNADGSQGISCTDLTSDQALGVTPALLDPSTKNNYIVVGEVDVNNPGTPTTQGTYAGSDPNVEATFIVAPGYNVAVADTYTGGYGHGDGTSLSAPMVAGAIAVIRSAYPSLNAQQVREVILESADTSFSDQYQKKTCGTSGNVNCGEYYFGVGMLDIEAALKLADNVVAGTATL